MKSIQSSQQVSNPGSFALEVLTSRNTLFSGEARNSSHIGQKFKRITRRDKNSTTAFNKRNTTNRSPSRGAAASSNGNRPHPVASTPQATNGSAPPQPSGSSNQETLRPTAFHKFYSETRDQWLSAEALQPGEILRGLTGPLQVVSQRPIPGTHRVYNMTVEAEHVYHVSTLGVLAHNTCSVKQPVRSRAWIRTNFDRLDEATRKSIRRHARKVANAKEVVPPHEQLVRYSRSKATPVP
ncbi:MAG: hypothetical protein GY722_14290, partial [bacterium]|nr:hypothetical protein [bacterium]